MAATKRITANARALGASTQFIAYAIIALVVLYSDVMFVSLMWSAFPGGFLTVAAIGGAFATGISVIALVIGKSHWFRPGGQLIWAWCFTALEIAVSILNVVVSVLSANGGKLGYLSAYLLVAPATPIVALVGWIVILYLDKDRQQLHEEMEMEDDLAGAEREHKRQVHEARMELKRTALEQQKEYLKMHLSSADVQRVLSEGSYEITRGIVSEIVQRPIMPRYADQAQPKIIDSTAQRIDTTGRMRALHPINKKLPPARKFTPTQPKLESVRLTDTQEVETGPLAHRPVGVKKNQGPYVVNRKPAPKLHVND